MRDRRSIIIIAVAAATLLSLVSVQRAAASETRQFAVSMSFPALAAEDGDCEAQNPDSLGILRQALKQMGKSPDEIERMVAFSQRNNQPIDISLRGKLDGKAVDAYLYPLSVPDSQLHLVRGTTGLGFNLDGQEKPGDFVDPITGERGVDNQLARVLGCSRPWRAKIGEGGPFELSKHELIFQSAPAWLIEISGIDSTENDDDVVVKVMLAKEPMTRDALGKPSAYMSFTANPTHATAGNVVHGSIKNGTLTTRTFDFYMPGEPQTQAEYRFKDARMRMVFTPAGGITAFLGGYQDWSSLYVSLALGRSVNELVASQDTPGHYYAFRKLADAYPDPKTGQNMYISSTYQIDAIPAFILYPEASQSGRAQ